jgi:hypothetical protein
MSNVQMTSLAAEATYPALAAKALAAIVETGASILVAEPWRVARIIRGADDMSIHELAAQLARRRRAGPPADLNRAIALAQLALVLKSPGFCTMWAARQVGSR